MFIFIGFVWLVSSGIHFLVFFFFKYFFGRNVKLLMSRNSTSKTNDIIAVKSFDMNSVFDWFLRPFFMRNIFCYSIRIFKDFFFAFQFFFFHFDQRRKIAVNLFKIVCASRWSLANWFKQAHDERKKNVCARFIIWANFVSAELTYYLFLSFCRNSVCRLSIRLFFFLLTPIRPFTRYFFRSIFCWRSSIKMTLKN